MLDIQTRVIRTLVIDVLPLLLYRHILVIGILRLLSENGEELLIRTLLTLLKDPLD